VLLALFVDVSHLDWLEFLAHLRMLGLVFLAALEVDTGVVARRWHANLGIGLSTISLALVFGFLRDHELLGSDGGQLLLGAAVPAAMGLPRLGRWVFARYRMSTAEFELRFILLLLVGMRCLAERVGVHGAWFSVFAPALLLRAGTLLVGLQAGLLDGRLFSAMLPVVLLSAAVPMIFLRALPDEG
jgi:Kef-type K+ transport system membrane component KefB